MFCRKKIGRKGLDFTPPDVINLLEAEIICYPGKVSVHF
jgi:hypothetical protein